jgi:glycopeptide antibiotics resistance protein
MYYNTKSPVQFFFFQFLHMGLIVWSRRPYYGMKQIIMFYFVYVYFGCIMEMCMLISCFVIYVQTKYISSSWELGPKEYFYFPS